jgi:integrase
MRLTDLTVRNLSVPEGRRTFFDDALTGFGVRVTPRSKTWVLIIHRHNRNEWETLGKYPIVSLQAARKAAADRLATIQLGQDRIAADLTFAEAFALFKQTHTAHKRASTRIETERLIEKHLVPKLGPRPLSSISTQDLTHLIDRLLSTPGICWHAFAAARLLFGWATKRRLLQRSPLEGVPSPAKSAPRERVLTQDELVLVWRASETLRGNFGPLLRLLILTGQRRNQIASLRAEWIDFERRTISFPSQVMKGGRAHTVPYGDLTMAILKTLPKSGLLFAAPASNTPYSAFSAAKQVLDRKLGGSVAPFVIHDLRRSFASAWQSIGVPIAVTETMLAHRSGSFAGIVSVYQRHDYLPEMRAAVERWEQFLGGLLNA